MSPVFASRRKRRGSRSCGHDHSAMVVILARWSLHAIIGSSQTRGRAETGNGRRATGHDGELGGRSDAGGARGCAGRAGGAGDCCCSRRDTIPLPPLIDRKPKHAGRALTRRIAGSSVFVVAAWPGSAAGKASYKDEPGCAGRHQGHCSVHVFVFCAQSWDVQLSRIGPPLHQRAAGLQT